MKSILYLILLEAVIFLVPIDIRASGTVDDHRFFSKALNREMTCRVYLPEEYEPDNPEKRFPAIYFLHGASLSYDQYDALFIILDNLIATKLIKPVILLLPDGLAPPYNGSFYTNSALYGNFEDYISHDLVTFADSAFHTRNNRAQRGIMGASMGGYGALKIAFRHPGLFVGVAGHSGPVNINMMDIFIPDLIAEAGGPAPFHWSPGPGKSLTDLTFTMAGAFSPNLSNIYQVDFPLDSVAKPIPAVMERWKTENVSEIAKSFNPETKMGITFDCGNSDEYHLYYQNRALADTLTKYHIPFRYEEYLGTHTSGLPLRIGLSFAYFDLLFKSDVSGVSITGSGSEWKVFANPAAGKLSIRNENFSPNLEKQVFQLADLTGRIVITKFLGAGSNETTTANLPGGLYFFRIQCGNLVQTGKTMIIR